MFGLFYALFGGTMKGAASIKNAVEDEQHRIKAKDAGELTYWHKGYRYVENGRSVYTKKDIEGNCQIVDVHNGTVYHTIENVQNIKHREESEKLKQQGIKYIEAKPNVTMEKYDQLRKRYFLFQCINDAFSRFNIVENIETKVLFHEIRIGDLTCYLDLNTGFIIDTDKNKSDENGFTAQEIMKKFNNAQQKRKEKIFKENSIYSACNKYFLPYKWIDKNFCVIDNEGKVYFCDGNTHDGETLARKLIIEGKLYPTNTFNKSKSNVEVY